MADVQAPINLSELLEKIRQEQDLLTEKVNHLDEIKRGLESQFEANKKIVRKLQEELNTIQKEILYVENDIKFLTSDYQKLVESNESVLSRVICQTEDIKIRNESNLSTMKYLNEAADQLGSSWDSYKSSVDSAFHFSSEGLRSKTLKSQKKDVADKIEYLLENEGSIDEIEVATNAIKLEHKKLMEDKIVLDTECKKIQDVIKERRAILTRNEIENKMTENRLQAQKKRLLKLLASSSPAPTSS